MRVFVAGATGVIGQRLLPLLISEGHHVTGMTRSARRGEALRAQGAEPVVADALDQPAVTEAVLHARPDAVIHQLTSLPRRIDPRKIERDFQTNDQLRSEGTRILVEAARRAGAGRIVAQSIAFMYEPGPPGTIHDEQDPLVREPPAAFARTAGAVKTLERTVLQAGGMVLRYGYFYGPGSAISHEGSFAEDLRRRRMPVVGRGGGVWSFVHVDDAAAATVATLSAKPGLASRSGGVYNIVDDDPAPVAEWLPALAKAVGAPKPMRVPAFVARLAAGEYGASTMTRSQGASNAQARDELGWAPAHPSWREGFRTALG
ncbi:MAG: NAD(P)-dependent oxidoreductase [Solirubrobacterales bacterium]|nr:NAD(P)-dependent oxidoreductase [Solirubrobacterales bacterium]